MKIVEEKNRITLYNDEGSYCGEITFQYRNDKVIVVDHTFVDDVYRGKGYAQDLLNQVVEYATKNKLKIIPQCPYVKRKFDEDGQYKEIEYCE